MDRYIFPAIFETFDNEPGYTITFPDLPGCFSEGNTLQEALVYAKEALELHLYSMEEDNEVIPLPSTPESIATTKGQFINLIESFMPLVRVEMANKAVKKTLTIPKWLNELAEDNKVNFSQILQQGLKDYLGVKEYTLQK
jgi:predicted RNase H-like HicB family nuclease